MNDYDEAEELPGFADGGGPDGGRMGDGLLRCGE
jgi:hypothetical protein